MNIDVKEQITNLWLSKINEFIVNLDIDDDLKTQVHDALINQRELIKTGTITHETSGTQLPPKKAIENFCNECLSFMNYLYSLVDIKGVEYFKTAIRYALSNDSDLSFMDNFIRFIVITNYNDIEVIDNINVDNLLSEMDKSSDEGYIRAYLGGFLVCDMSKFGARHDKNGNPNLDFFYLHSRKNMTRTKVGTLLIKKVLNKMINDERLHDFSLGSMWVQKRNTLGKKFYEKTGFRFKNDEGEYVDYNYYDNYINVKREDYPELTDVEYEELRKKNLGNFTIEIPSGEKEKVLNSEFEYPYIEFEGERIDCTTDFSRGRTI